MQAHVEKLDKHLSNIPVLVQAENKLKVKHAKVYVAAGLGLVVVASLVSNIGAKFTTGVIATGWAAPRFISAVNKNQQEDIKKWGLYYLLLGVWSLAETGLCSVVKAIPFYWILKGKL
jgi:hypothetical protein